MPESGAEVLHYSVPAMSCPGSITQRVNPLNDPQWDAKIATLPDASFFHSAAWALVLHRTYGFDPGYFTVTESGRLRALLPAMEVNSWLTGRRGITLPFTDECGALGANPQIFEGLFQTLLTYANVRRWRHWEFRGGRSWFEGAPASLSFFGHKLDLTGGDAALFARLSKSAKGAVRKAEQNGITVEFSQSLDDIRTFHGLLCRTRKRHGVPPQPLPFFENIQRHVLATNQGYVLLARHKQVPIAGAVFFHFGKTALYKFAASDEAYKHLSANNLVLWRAIEWYARQGFVTLDFGRTSLANDGLRRFKLAWGAREYPIDYVKYDRRSSRFVTSQDQSAGWHNRIFKLLPNSLSRLIGAAAYKHIA